ncbi:MAG: zinc-ribbon domain-containing protein, partial [Leptolyngbya sp. SIO1D8]|nr:zinc-ribbon domain-containing protein [Leptolyngbya sp. SIO1D8]
MIVCPNCNHQNPDGAVQCEACYTPLPTLANCPSCGASVQSDASFCGQCGFDLRAVNPVPPVTPEEATIPDGESLNSDDAESTEFGIPDLIPPDPLVVPEPISAAETSSSQPVAPSPSPINALEQENPPFVPEVTSEVASEPEVAAVPQVPIGETQLQINQVKLFHVQTNTVIELPPQLTFLHLGKPNDRVPPTIDVSGFPDSEIVSRVHASIR